MAKQDLVDNGKEYTDPSGTVWEQVTYRKLAGGDYVRVLLEKYGRRLLLQFGEVLSENKELIAWRWEVPLTAEDSINLLGDVSFGILQATKNTTAYIGAAGAKTLDLETRLVATAIELRDLKDKPKEAGDAAQAGQ